MALKWKAETKKANLERQQVRYDLVRQDDAPVTAVVRQNLEPVVRQYENGTLAYLDENGKYHREDGPAIERDNGDKFWCRHGDLHREDGPAAEHVEGSLLWALNNCYHREDGPAAEWSDGRKEWWVNGRRHRKDGPAIEYPDGGSEYWQYGLLHNLNGLALLLPDGTGWSYMRGMLIGKNDFYRTRREYNPISIEQYRDDAPVEYLHFSLEEHDHNMPYTDIPLAQSDRHALSLSK